MSSRRNILFILTDQERYFDTFHSDLEVPGRRWLMERGVTFTNHYIASTYCTSSRSVIYTGQHMPNTRMFDNVGYPFVPSLPVQIPTVGSMLRDVGYYTAYKGKWHLSAELEPDDQRDHDYSRDMERYGFSDWNPTGDVTGDPLDGFIADNGTMMAAVEWLRTKGLRLRAQDTPWFLSVDLVNPHDIMYFNTDRPGEPVQDTGELILQTTFAPDTPTYAQTYDDVVPNNYMQDLGEEGRPSAHEEFEGAMGYALGRVPAEADRWQRFNDYYLNCIREVDRKIAFLIRELEDLGMLDDTVIVFTSDHGEMGGAHGMRGKGGNSYEESLHVPLVVVTPGGPEGVVCDAVTSHIDLAPTFVGLSDATATPGGLPGKDLTGLIDNPAGPVANGRDAALFTFSGVLSLDSQFVGQVASVIAAGGKLPQIRQLGVMPDFTKRGFQRTVFDGRYKFSRYFAPSQHHLPGNVDEVREYNDIELFDLAEDPTEMTNLAARGRDHDDLIARMNHMLNKALQKEVGVAEDGRYLPNLPGMSWAFDEIKNV